MKTLTSHAAAARVVRVMFLAMLVTVVMGALGARRAEAGPLGLSGYGGLYDGEDYLLGAGVRVGFANLAFNPNFEYYYFDNITAYSLNLDATLVVIPAAVASGWVGAGVGFVTLDLDVGDANTETVYNVLAGAGLNAFPLKPYTQLKLVVQDGDDSTVLSVGVRF